MKKQTINQQTIGADLNKTANLTPRKQRGYTLVPTVVAIVIATATTVAFVSQGKGLMADNNRLLATNEIATTLASYNTTRATGVAMASVNATKVPGLTGVNVYGTASTWSQPTWTYTPDSDVTCQQLATTFTGAGGVGSIACNAAAGSNPATVAITLN